METEVSTLPSGGQDFDLSAQRNTEKCGSKDWKGTAGSGFASTGDDRERLRMTDRLLPWAARSFSGQWLESLFVVELNSSIFMASVLPHTNTAPSGSST